MKRRELLSMLPAALAASGAVANAASPDVLPVTDEARALIFTFPIEAGWCREEIRAQISDSLRRAGVDIPFAVVFGGTVQMLTGDELKAAAPLDSNPRHV